MKFIDEFDIELVNQALTFNTTEMHVQGTCDLFTTKPIGIDRKLYKRLDRRYSFTKDKEELKNELREAAEEQAEQEGHGKKERHGKTARSDSSSSSGSPVVEKVDLAVNPAFMLMKRRSSSYSIPDKGVGITKRVASRYASSNRHKPRSKSFQLTKDGNNAFDAVRQDRGTETLDYYSPFGPLSQQSSRRLFAYLIGILNATYPDHDFSLVQPDNFTLLASPEVLIKRVNSLLISLGKSSGLDWVWQTIDTHMDIGQCTCFQYEPEQSFLNDLHGTLWCNMYFMYNKKRKRVAFLYIRASSIEERAASSIPGTGHSKDEYEEVFESDDDGVESGEDDRDDDGNVNRSPSRLHSATPGSDEEYLDGEDLPNENQDDEDSDASINRSEMDID